MSKYAYKRVGGKWQLVERKTNRVVPVGERPANWFKQIGKGIKRVYDATEGKRQKEKLKITDKALAYTGKQTKGLTDKLVWDERTLAGGELYDAKRGPLTISQAKKLERENLAIYKRDQAYNKFVQQQKDASEFFTNPTPTNAAKAQESAVEEGMEALPESFGKFGVEIAKVSQGGGKLINVGKNIGSGEELTPVSGKGVESLKIAEDPTDKLKIKKSNVFTKAAFDFAGVKKGQSLGVLTRNQRRMYDKLVAGG